jgi:hypothetical protein
MSATWFGPLMPLSRTAIEKFFAVVPDEPKYVADIIKGGLVFPNLVDKLGFNSTTY